MTMDPEVGYDAPARVGMRLDEVMTPALVVDLDAFERNVAKMRDHAATMGVALRAHAKTHKSADIARHQMAEGGAVGVCCQKVSEAEALVRGGIGDVLIANEVTEPAKIARLVRLASQARVRVCVDAPTNVLDLSEAASAAGLRLEVLVEIDCGAARCGIAPGEPAVALARRVSEAPGLAFVGLQSYHGGAQHIADAAQRRAAVADSTRKTAETVALLAAADIPCPVVTGAGTGTFAFEGVSGVYTEIQCGSYIFMDVDYGRIQGADGGGLGFENALFVLSAVISHPTATRAVCDAGLKAHSVDSGLPTVYDGNVAGVKTWPNVSYAGASDEHGTLADPGNALAINDRVLLVPGHCDPTCNLHDWFVGVRGGRVECLWPVTARGKLF